MTFLRRPLAQALAATLLGAPHRQATRRDAPEVPAGERGSGTVSDPEMIPRPQTGPTEPKMHAGPA